MTNHALRAEPSGSQECASREREREGERDNRDSRERETTVFYNLGRRHLGSSMFARTAGMAQNLNCFRFGVGCYRLPWLWLYNNVRATSA